MAVAESALLANAVTNGLFRTDLKDFLMGTKDGAYKPGTDGSERLTLPELLGAGPGGLGGNYSSAYPGGLGQVLKANAMANGAQMLTSLVAIPVGFKVASSLLKKPRRQANALLRQVGIDGVKL